jgi:hypothetical protein
MYYCCPTGNVAPEASPVVCAVVAPVQLSATGKVYTTAPQVPGVLFTEILAGQVIAGA